MSDLPMPPYCVEPAIARRWKLLRARVFLAQIMLRLREREFELFFVKQGLKQIEGAELKALRDETLQLAEAMKALSAIIKKKLEEK